MKPEVNHHNKVDPVNHQKTKHETKDSKKSNERGEFTTGRLIAVGCLALALVGVAFFVDKDNKPNDNQLLNIVPDNIVHQQAPDTVDSLDSLKGVIDTTPTSPQQQEQTDTSNIEVPATETPTEATNQQPKTQPQDKSTVATATATKLKPVAKTAPKIANITKPATVATADKTQCIKGKFSYNYSSTKSKVHMDEAPECMPDPDETYNLACNYNKIVYCDPKQEASFKSMVAKMRSNATAGLAGKSSKKTKKK